MCSRAYNRYGVECWSFLGCTAESIGRKESKEREGEGERGRERERESERERETSTHLFISIHTHLFQYSICIQGGKSFRIRVWGFGVQVLGV